MNRSYSKIRHIQETNRLVEERMLNEKRVLTEQAANNEWLTYLDDKNYQYQKQNGKWVAKVVKTGKVVDLSKYPTTIQKLDAQFPDAKSEPINNLTPKPLQTLDGKPVASSSTPVSTVSATGPTGTSLDKNKLPTGTIKSTPQDLKGGLTPQSTVSSPGGAGFVLKPGMTGVGILSDTAEGKTYVVNKVTPLQCDLIEVEFKNKGNRLEYGYYEPSKYKTNSISFRRKGEGVKSANACTEYNTFGDFGHLKFS